MANTYLANDINVIAEEAFCRKEYIRPLQELGVKADSSLTVNIEATLEKYIERATMEREHCSKLEKERVTAIHNEYRTHMFPVDATFSSDQHSLEEITDKVIAMLANDAEPHV